MNFIRFTDLCAQGKVSGQRVCIRADLNGSQNANGNIAEGARISASMDCFQLVLDLGVAVIVTSHLGGLADSLAQIAKRRSDFSSSSV